jgi:hypothetical protein
MIRCHDQIVVLKLEQTLSLPTLLIASEVEELRRLSRRRDRREQ